MNKLLTFFAAPITAFFYPPVYKDAVKSSASRGVLYCLYLAGLATVLLMILLSVKVMPQADNFATWLQGNMPFLVWTPDGLSLENGKTSAELTHPKYGKIAFFDMAQTSAEEANFNGAYVLVTSQKIFTKTPQGQIEERAITQGITRPGQQPPQRIRITGEIAEKLYQNLKKVFLSIMTFLTLIVSFIFILASNLFYSLAGLLMNLMRKEKLRYGAIFNLTCFATSAGFTLLWIKVLLPFPIYANALVNLAFMFFAFKVTDKKEAA